ncbi:GNAT family N-acetyltransferase [Spiribacter roseus]|uniref:GNAT family N-acetyltransferase n=1 Tax=Spiribacter roseus TaxID=1855875 RepID=UPI001330063C|nr:GNAT family N-acetyltransferase [Spiribacter roseus]
MGPRGQGGQHELTVRHIELQDKTGALSLGEAEFAPLKAFLRNEAFTFHRENVARTYVAVDAGGSVRGYVTLICSQIQVSQEQHRPEVDNRRIRYDSFPSIKVARLAIDKRYRGSGLGRQFLDLALAIALGDVMPVVGCRFLVGYAKRPSVEFYLKYGFTPIQESHEDQGNPVLFLDLHPHV